MSIFRLITQMLPSADYIVPVEIESQVHNVYVIKRPGVDRFLTEMGKIYEIVVFTASLSKVCLCHDLCLIPVTVGADHTPKSDAAFVWTRAGVDCVARYSSTRIPASADVQYADPVLDMLDPAGVVKHRLFRESCYNHKGNYVKVCPTRFQIPPFLPRSFTYTSVPLKHLPILSPRAYTKSSHSEMMNNILTS